MTDLKYIHTYLPENEKKEAEEKLKKNINIQYIVGNVDFYGNKILVNENVLIPRFETELLVEKVIHYIEKYFDKKIDILDIGTGSGCIAITLKKEVNANIDAIDISEEALEVAKENAKLNDVDIYFTQGDLFSNISKKYDVIISNPPYLSKDEEVMDIVKNNEPHIALYADNNGLKIYERIFRDVKNYINRRAIIAFEIGYTQEKELEKLCKKTFPQDKYIFEKDLSGKTRYLFIFTQNKNMKSI